MKFRIVFFLFFFVACNNTFALTSMTKSFRVSTYIDKSKILPYSIDVNLEKDIIVFSYDKDSKKFKDELVNLDVTSNIPSDDIQDISYSISLIENSSECRNIIDNELTQENFIDIYINGVNINKGDTQVGFILDKIDGNNFKSAQLSFLIKSKKINNILQSCEGSVGFMTQLAL
ncbi:hypothetical protein [Photobacterium damselae]|uniref:hypothetical protein n=1 Tax=Photobacterium damselae TaxID=38293 RepID=UPI001593DC58|nr:hypothetical protein [Photobacterium damselae]NVH46722.1 hypothetical protein [Photobacterium damselae subsp. damselae]